MWITLGWLGIWLRELNWLLLLSTQLLRLGSSLNVLNCFFWSFRLDSLSDIHIIIAILFFLMFFLSSAFDRLWFSLSSGHGLGDCSLLSLFDIKHGFNFSLLVLLLGFDDWPIFLFSSLLDSHLLLMQDFWRGWNDLILYRLVLDRGSLWAWPGQDWSFNGLLVELLHLWLKWHSSETHDLHGSSDCVLSGCLLGRF